jgi:hypothetical protein
MMLMSQFSLEAANPWKKADEILTRLSQERAKERAKNKKQRPAPDHQPPSSERRSEQRKRPRPQRHVLYPI